jgi:tetratricopeptide (TPR) repeat protein
MENISKVLDKRIALLFTQYKWRNVMKSVVLGSFGVFIFLLCAATGNTKNNGNSSEDITEDESMDIKVIDPVPMVAPSKSEQAMREYGIGTQLLNENRLEESEKHLREAIRFDPLFADAMDHLGRVYRIQNRLQEAEEIYLKSIEINDRNKVPYQNLAIVYRLQGRLNDALELYKKMIQLDENDPEPYYGIGGLFYIVGDYENSMPFFDKAIELYIKSNSTFVYDVFLYKGMIYFRMEEYDQALKYLEEAQKGNPNSTTIENTINEIKNKK